MPTPFTTRNTLLTAVTASTIFTMSATAATFTRVATLGGTGFESTSGQVNGAINSSGTVAGGSQNAGGNYHAYTAPAATGTPTDLGVVPTSPAAAYAYGYSINDAGQVAGAINATNFSNRAYVYTPGSTTGTGGTGFNVLNQTATAVASVAYGINSAGTPVGTVSYTYTDASGPHTAGQAFVYLNSTMYTLGSFGGTNGASDASAINDAGTIVGSSTTAAGQSRAYKYALTTDTAGAPNGTMAMLPTLGGTSNRAYGINTAGDIVGWSNTTAGDRHAFLLKSAVATPVDLGGPYPDSFRAEAYDVNASDAVVGTDYSNVGQHATLWAGGTAIDLNAFYHTSVAGADANLSLVYAYGINDAGQIFGYGTDASTGRSINFVLTGVPEPTASALLAIGGVLLRRRRR